MFFLKPRIFHHKLSIYLPYLFILSQQKLLLNLIKVFLINFNIFTSKNYCFIYNSKKLNGYQIKLGLLIFNFVAENFDLYVLTLLQYFISKNFSQISLFEKPQNLKRLIRDKKHEKQMKNFAIISFFSCIQVSKRAQCGRSISSN